MTEFVEELPQAVISNLIQPLMDIAAVATQLYQFQNTVQYQFQDGTNYEFN